MFISYGLHLICEGLRIVGGYREENCVASVVQLSPESGVVSLLCVPAGRAGSGGRVCALEPERVHPATGSPNRCCLSGLGSCM